MRNDARSARGLLRGGDFDVADLAIARVNVAALGQRILGLNVGPVLVHQIIDAGSGGAYFPVIARLIDKPSS